jgi:hypothetical protein
MGGVYRDGADAARRRLLAVRERALSFDDELPPGAFARRSRTTAQQLRELRYMCAAVDHAPEHVRDAERLWTAYEDELRRLFADAREPVDPMAAVTHTVVARHDLTRKRWPLSQRDARALTDIVRGVDRATRIDWLASGTLMVANPRVAAMPTCVVAERRGNQCVVTTATEVARRSPWLEAREDRGTTLSPQASGDLAFKQQFQVIESGNGSGALAGPVGASLLKLSFLNVKPYLYVGDGIASFRVAVACSATRRSQLRPELFTMVLRVLAALHERWLPPRRAAPTVRQEKEYGRWPPPAARH